MPVEVRYAAARLETAKGEPAGVLLPEECARAAAYADGGPRGRFVAGRLLVRRLAAGLLDMDPGAGPGLGIRSDCPRCGAGSHGRPSLVLGEDPLDVSLAYSRAGEWVLVAVGPGGVRLGVDLAEVEDPAFAGGRGANALEESFFSADERRRVTYLLQRHRPRERARIWTVKEALAKATGEGIAGSGGPPVVLGQGMHQELAAGRGRVHQLDPRTVGMPPGMVATAVVLGSRRT